MIRFYNLMNILPNAIPGFGSFFDVILKVIKLIFGGGINYQKSSLVNTDSIETAKKVLGLILNKEGYNFAAPWIEIIKDITTKKDTATTLVKVLQAIWAIADKGKDILNNKANKEGISLYYPRPVYFLNAKNEAMEKKLESVYQTNINQNYFHPTLEGDYGKIAKGTHSTARVINKSFETPIFAETKTGTFIFTDYQDVSFNSRTNKGEGKMARHLARDIGGSLRARQRTSFQLRSHLRGRHAALRAIERGRVRRG